MDHFAWTTEGGVVLAILTPVRLVVCMQVSQARAALGSGGFRSRPQPVLLGAVELAGVLQIRETSEGVNVIGLEPASGPLSRCALRCRALFIGRSYRGGERNLCWHGGRVEYSLALRIPARCGARGWLVDRLRRSTRSDSSLLSGEDWNLLPIVVPKQQQQIQQPPADSAEHATGNRNGGMSVVRSGLPGEEAGDRMALPSGGVGGPAAVAEQEKDVDLEAAARAALAGLDIRITG